MPVFIADHTGSLQTRSSFVRPIHIGAALCDQKDRGQEPDLWAHSISEKASYADLRLWHYLGALSFEDTTPIAIMQYRRMFFLGKPNILNRGRKLRKQAKAIQISDTFQSPQDASLRDPYLKWLARQSDRTLTKMLGDTSLIVNETSFPNHTLQAQYKVSIANLYPDEMVYWEAWDKMRACLENRLGRESVAASLNGKAGCMNNMMVGRAKDVLAYRSFLFDVLGELSEYENVFRIYGYLAERIQSAWVAHQVAKNGFQVRHQAVMLYGEPVI